MMKGERREQKRKRAWYKQHMANNHKALMVLLNAIEKRRMKVLTDGK